MHTHAFSGILDVVDLDLSFTSIERLPTDGLDDLEVLRIQKTHSLKQIPSLYFFKNLKHAYLTHSFHCCAFKFPKQHDPELHKKKLKWIEEQQANCVQSISSHEVRKYEIIRLRLFVILILPADVCIGISLILFFPISF